MNWKWVLLSLFFSIATAIAALLATAYVADDSGELLAMFGLERNPDSIRDLQIRARPVGGAAEPHRRTLAQRYIGHVTQPYCRPSNLGAIRNEEGAKVYRWLDNEGQAHFSDRQPVGTDKHVDQLAVHAQGYGFDLNLSAVGAVLPVEFRNELVVRIHKSYDVLASFMPSEALQAVALNVKIFGSQSDYERVYKRYAADFVGSTSGFHAAQDNLAAVLRKTDAQLLRTSMHEAVHVMNSGMFGRLPRWVNEGLAEYLEQLKVFGQAVEIPVAKFWLRELSRKRLPLTFVVGANDKDWQGELRHSLYAHSWALVFFLFESADGRALVRDYLLRSARTPCKINSSSEFLAKYYPGGVRLLSENFNDWLKQPKQNQYY